MAMNVYEESVIRKKSLPKAWQSQASQDELEEMLQNSWDQRKIFYNDEEWKKKQQFLLFQSHNNIRTKKYIGSISFNGEQLNIFPKVFREAKGDDDTSDLSIDHLMLNLRQWLEYCNRIIYPFVHITADYEDAQDLRELFVTLYVGYVKASLEHGLYYSYIEDTQDLPYIRGRFDVMDYVTRKIPGGNYDKFRCTYSTFEFDNWINRIIKYTCKYIYNGTSKRNQKLLRRIFTLLNDVSDVPCTPADCDRVRLSSMQSAYKVIMSMSKMFLFNKTSGYQFDSKENYCFLFPTDYLFEGFIGGFLQEVVKRQGGKVWLQRSDMYLIDDLHYAGESYGAAFTMRHDILARIGSTEYVLDTKYKQIERFADNPDEIKQVVSDESKQTDVYQVCEYARKRNLKDVFLLYPMYRYEDHEEEFPYGDSISADGNIKVHFVRIPFVFEEDTEHTENEIRMTIENNLGLQPAEAAE